MVETFSLDKKFIKILLYRLTVGVASSDADDFQQQPTETTVGVALRDADGFPNNSQLQPPSMSL